MQLIFCVELGLQALWEIGETIDELLTTVWQNFRHVLTRGRYVKGLLRKKKTDKACITENSARKSEYK